MKPLLDADTLLAHSTVVNTTGVVYLGTTRAALGTLSHKTGKHFCTRLSVSYMSNGGPLAEKPPGPKDKNGAQVIHPRPALQTVN